MKYAALLMAVLVLLMTGCEPNQPPVANSGVRETTVKVPTQSNGLTVEQNNVRERYQMDNKPGSIKYLYVISAYSGDVLIYSTVRGKVTSSGKRLSPRTVEINGNYASGIPVTIGGNGYRTPEVIEDDGTYGDSVPYVYWWDSKSNYHQHFLSGGQILHISDQPLVIKHAIINMEETARPPEKAGSAAQ